MREKGFTLIELMIVVAIIAIIAAIAIPNLLRARLAANESSAIASLRTLSSAEETFRSSIMEDKDTDGLGEYGTLGQLAGSATCQPSGRVASPPFIDNQLGQGQKSGYEFNISIGSAAGCGIGGGSGGGSGAATNASEISYFAYALPVSYGRSGNRSFVLDASGVIRGSDQGGGTQPACSSACMGSDAWPVIG